MPSWLKNAVIVVGLAVVAYLLLRKFAGDVGGIFSGNNSVTKNATNASGATVTAYEGKGFIGTLGAATNTATGGALASLGEWIGQNLPVR